MRAPDLLVIGAMKCGTTTLFRDLQNHPSVGLVEKESAGLELVNDPNGRRAAGYLQQWDDLPGMPVVGEVNTTYAMAPHYPGVPERAAMIAPEAKILYIVREPIERIVSHHRHDTASGVVTSPIDEAVRTDARFLDYSRYASQIGLWRDHFPSEAVRVVRFEDYVSDRRAQANKIVAWLGLAPFPMGTSLHEVHNPSESRRSARGLLRRVLHGQLYRQHLRRAVPQRIQRLGRSVLLPPTPARPAPPTRETVRWLADVLTEEVEALSSMNGGVCWELADVVAAYENPGGGP